MYHCSYSKFTTEKFEEIQIVNEHKFPLNMFVTLNLCNSCDLIHALKNNQKIMYTTYKHEFLLERNSKYISMHYYFQWT